MDDTKKNTNQDEEIVTDIDTAEELEITVPAEDIEETAVADADSVEVEKTVEVETTEDVVETLEEDLTDSNNTDEGGEPEYATEQASQAMKVVNLDSLIKRYLHDIDRLKEELKMQRQMLDDACANDAEFHAQNERIKEANKVKNGIRQKILKQPEVAMLAEKVNDIREEMKDAQNMLSGYVEQYQKLSGMNQIVHDDGSVHEIVNSTKLVKKGKYRP